MPIVFITGSGKRIGRGLALEFAKKNWDVVIHYYDSEVSAFKTLEEIRSLGVKGFIVRADVRIKSELEDAFDRTINEFGIPDVLINNSGIFPETKKISEINEEFWNNTLNINLRGEFFASQIFSNLAKSGSKIVNIASLGGLEIWKHRIPYNVSKAGVIQLTKALARELAPNITVNTVCPGAIYVDEEPSINDTTLLDLNKIPMKRLGNPKDIFDAVYFFSTCSNYITAQILTVDGGYHDAR